MGKIKAIGFDYGGVIAGKADTRKRFTEISAKLLNMTSEEWEKQYFALNHLLNTGKVKSKREFWTLFLGKLSKLEKLEEVLAIDLALGQEYVTINEEVLGLIDTLRRAGHKVGLLSNAGEKSGQVMRELGIHTHFDTFLISAEIGLQKPDPRSFAHLSHELGVEMEELAFIDDSPSSLSTALECKFTPILFESYAQLVTDLTTLKVL